MITSPCRVGGLFLVAMLSFSAGMTKMRADYQQSLRQVSLPGRPFGVAVSKDLQWIFVSIIGGPRETPGIAVLQNRSGGIEPARMVPMGRSPEGVVLSHDGSMLIAAADDCVVFFDVQRLEAGENDPAFQWVVRGKNAGCVYVNVTADDRTLFVSDEFAKTITVIDLDRIRSIGRDSAKNVKHVNDRDGPSTAIVGRIPVGMSPIALTFSKDERWLFTTSEVAAPEWRWPRTIVREGARSSQDKVSEGAVIVIDVLKARINPQQSVVARVAAGGSPVRAALSQDGARLFVTARNSDAVLAFETADLTSGHDRTKPVRIPVGKSPVPIILTNDGRFALVGNSNRYSADVTRSSTLSVLDTSRVGTALNPVIGNIPCGAFPRNFCLGSDGRSLFLTNFQSASLQIIDSDRLLQLLEK